MTDLPPWAQALLECERRVLGPGDEERERSLMALTALLSLSEASSCDRVGASPVLGFTRPRFASKAGRAAEPS